MSSDGKRLVDIPEFFYVAIPGLPEKDHSECLVIRFDRDKFHDGYSWKFTEEYSVRRRYSFSTFEEAVMVLRLKYPSSLIFVRVGKVREFYPMDVFNNPEVYGLKEST